MQRAAPTSSAASTANAGRMRKTSEIARPSFKIEEETEGTGMFASSVMNNRPAFSFREPEPLPETPEPQDFIGEEEDRALLNRQLQRIKVREGRRGSKTTDDLKESVSGFQEPDDPDKSGSGDRRGSLLRSKSVKCVNFKFGLIPADAREGNSESTR